MNLNEQPQEEQAQESEFGNLNITIGVKYAHIS